MNDVKGYVARGRKRGGGAGIALAEHLRGEAKRREGTS